MKILFAFNVLHTKALSPGWFIGPGSWLEPGLKDTLWSRFKTPTGTNGGGPGARSNGPGSSHQPGPKGPDEPGPMPPRGPAGPWPHEPGPGPPIGPGSGLNRD